MKTSDVIVECLKCKSISGVFFYTGGMVKHQIHSFSKHQYQITAHGTCI